MRFVFFLSWKRGLLTIRVSSVVFQLKAPWYPPLFSERYGYKPHHSIGGGWRWAFFRPSELKLSTKTLERL